MSWLGRLLRNRRPDERSYGWNQANLAAPETIKVTSQDFTDGSGLPKRHAGRRAGGENLSPQLSWSELPDGTAEVLLLVEDLDVPLGSAPAIHCLAVIDPAALATPNQLPAGGLAKRSPAPGVTLLRSTIGRGYLGPEPVKGHGPHRYVFQVFALGASVRGGGDAVTSARPRAALAGLGVPVLARGRITGLYER